MQHVAFAHSALDRVSGHAMPASLRRRDGTAAWAKLSSQGSTPEETFSKEPAVSQQSSGCIAPLAAGVSLLGYCLQARRQARRQGRGSASTRVAVFAEPAEHASPSSPSDEAAKQRAADVSAAIRRQFAAKAAAVKGAAGKRALRQQELRQQVAVLKGGSQRLQMLKSKSVAKKAVFLTLRSRSVSSTSSSLCGVSPFGLSAAGCTRAVILVAQAASGKDEAVIGAALKSGSKAAKMAAAVEIGRSTASKMRLATKAKDKRALRQNEIKMKMQVLKGSKASIYKGKRRSGDEASDRRSEEDSEEESGASGQVGSYEAAESGQAATNEWAFDRAKKSGADKITDNAWSRYNALEGFELSDESRAVAAQELAGNAKASSASILRAATELSKCGEWTNSARLLERGRERIIQEQLERDITVKEAQELDEGHLRLLGTAYTQIGRLNVARETLLNLRDVVTTENQRQDVSRTWMAVSFKYGSSLLERRNRQAALDVFQNMLDTVPKGIAGAELWEETYLYLGMTLHELGRDDEAKEKLSLIYRDSMSGLRKRQARFIYDVINSDVVVERDPEMDKIWNSTVTLPAAARGGTTISRVGVRGVRPLQYEASRFQTWAATYWEERMKSPVYYAFLTLWVTWPFAIPVVSIARRSGLID